MGAIGPLERVLAEHDMKSAQDYSKKVKDQLTAEQAESLKVYETFHTHLALLAGGTVALSVTYLGYLQNSGVKVVHIWVLVASWICLVAAIPLSLFVAFLHSHYMFYGRMTEYRRAMSEQRRSEASALGRIPVVEMPEERIPAERERLINSAARYEDSAKTSSKFEKVYFHLWRIDGWAARFLFILGLALLLLFASWNTLHRHEKQNLNDFVKLFGETTHLEISAKIQFGKEGAK